MSRDRVTFQRRALSTFVSIGWLVFTLGFIGEAVQARSAVGQAIVGAMAGVCAVMTVRGYRMGVVVGRDGVVSREFHRTRRLRWDEIVEFVAQPSFSGYDQPGYSPAAQLWDGRIQKFGILFSRKKKDSSGPTRAEEIVDYLNQRLAAARQQPPE